MARDARLCDQLTAECSGFAPTAGCTGRTAPAAAAGMEEECKGRLSATRTHSLCCVPILKCITRMMQFTTGPFFAIFYQSHLETPAETGEAAV